MCEFADFGEICFAWVNFSGVCVILGVWLCFRPVQVLNLGILVFSGDLMCDGLGGFGDLVSRSRCLGLV